MTEKVFAIRGDLCWSRDQQNLQTIKDGYLICENGVSVGVCPSLPEKYKGIRVIDARDRLVLPGMTDLHLHASQYTYRGLGMDLQLLDWLNTYTFPAESCYQDLDYASKYYQIFAHDLKVSVTTRAVIFATIHRPATEILMEELEKTGLITLVGKVNMDRNGSETLCEESAAAALADTEQWIQETKDRFAYTKPVLTPRFTPCCSDELMVGLGKLRSVYQLPVQSHLSENLSEIEWVKELCPWSEDYSDTYDRPGLLRGSIMAHCVWSGEKELERLARREVTIAHCPASNTNIASGIAPVRKYMDMGLKIGLGSDIAGGNSISLLRTIEDAISVSKLRWRLTDQSLKPLSLEEAFWLATIGGGSYFGKVGSFDPGFELDAVILDDSSLRPEPDTSIEDRVSRYIYCAGHYPERICGKFVGGRSILSLQSGNGQDGLSNP